MHTLKEIFEAIIGIFIKVGLAVGILGVSVGASTGTIAGTALATGGATILVGGAAYGVYQVAWRREPIWRSMANDVRESILNHDSFKKLVESNQELLKID
jgi:hypothetical protein